MQFKSSRRAFLKTGALGLATTALPYRLIDAQSLIGQDVVSETSEQDLRSLTSAALEAAKGAGAAYADVHFRVSRREEWVGGGLAGSGLSASSMIPSITVSWSIRSLVNGYWGFCEMDGISTIDKAAKLGRDATALARIAAKGKARTVDLAPLPAPANGSWIMPGIDPFTVSFEEKYSFLSGIFDFIGRQSYGVSASGRVTFLKEERTFASTEGAFTSQTVYTTGARLSAIAPDDWFLEQRGSRSADFLTLSGAGWEYVRNAPYEDRAVELIEEALRSRRKKPIDIGRYDIVFDAKAMADLVSTTIGAATELDRAFGYEANNAGTSYITEPLEMLGTFKIGSSLLNVTTNRSMPGGTATVKWDEEGAEPEEATIVKDGLLNDFQTTRESASWIASYYQKSGVPIRSNGCAGQYIPPYLDKRRNPNVAITISPVTHVNPNFVITPGSNDVSINDLIKDTKKGLLVLGGETSADQQALNGSGTGTIVYEIADGKIGSAISRAVYLYRTPDFWKNLVAIGGKKSTQQHGIESERYGGVATHTVSAVPAKVTGVAVTDATRKA